MLAQGPVWSFERHFLGLLPARGTPHQVPRLHNRSQALQYLSALSRAEQISLTKDLASSRSLKSLQELFLRHREDLNLIHTVTLFNQLQKVVGSRFKQPGPLSITLAPLKDDLVQLACRHLPDMGPRELSILAWSSAKCGLASAWLLDDLVLYTQRAMPGMDARQLSMVVWSLATMRYLPPMEWLEAFLDRSQELLVDCSPQGLANMLWALAKFELVPGEDWCTSYLSTVARQLSNCSPVELQQIIWSLAKLGICPEDEWLTTFCQCVRQSTSGLQPHHYNVMLWSFTELGYKPSNRFLREFLLSAESQMADFKSDDVVQLISALSLLERVPLSGSFFDTLLDHSQVCLPDVDHEGLTKLARSLQDLSCFPGQPWWDSFLGVLNARLSLMSLADLGVVVLFLVEKKCQVEYKLWVKLEGKCVESVTKAADDFSVSGLMNVCYGMLRCGYGVADPLRAALLTKLEDKWGLLGACTMCRGLWVVGSLGGRGRWWADTAQRHLLETLQKERKAPPTGCLQILMEVESFPRLTLLPELRDWSLMVLSQVPSTPAEVEPPG